MGKPIAVEKESNPSKETIDKIHAQYMAALIKLFDDNKARFGLKDISLQFLDWLPQK